MGRGSGQERAVSGLAGACVQLAAQELTALALGARSPLAARARAAIDLTPAPITDVAIVALREQAKPFLRASVAMSGLAAGAGAARVSARGFDAAAGTIALAGGLACATRPDARTGPSLVACGAGAAAGLAAHSLLRRRGPAAALGVAAVAGAVGASASRASLRTPAAPPLPPLPPPAETLPATSPHASLPIPGLRPLITEAERIYKTDLAIPVPAVDLDSWRLRVTGEVEREIELSYEELLSLPLVEVCSTLVCVHNPLGGDRVSTGRWLGVPVPDLLAHAGVRPRADQVLAHAVDGFTSSLPLAALRDRHSSIVAVGVNGRPLPPANGFPARLITPGSYGQWANLKWLARLELTRLETAPDYWARRGWPQTGAVRPGSQIDVPADGARVPPGEVTIAGVAWSPPDGVRSVEVSIDRGPWTAATLAAEVAPTAWRQWRVDWTAAPGVHRIRVRCEGQEERIEAPFPAGYGGCHEVSVTVDAADGSVPADGARRRFATASAEAAHRGRYVIRIPGAWIRHRRGSARPR